MPDFLLEIGCEEIPARMIDAGSQELRERVGKLLERERLAPSGTLSSFDSPRRLAVLASGIPAAQPDVTEQITGPSTAVAYKDGQPTAAAHAFAKKAGVDVAKLERASTPKGEYLSAKVRPWSFEPFHNQYTLRQVRQLLSGFSIVQLGYSRLRFNVVFVARNAGVRARSAPLGRGR